MCAAIHVHRRLLMYAGGCVLLASLLLGGTPCAAQGLRPRVHAAYGSNLLLSPGTDLQSSPGRTGQLGFSLAIGRPDAKLAFVPALRASQHAFRTRMAYRVHFSTIRSQFDLDLAMGLRQMSGTMWQFGAFVGTVSKVTNRIEQQAGNNTFPTYPLTTLRSELYDRTQLGALIALWVPLDEGHRWGLDLMARYHFTPLVKDGQEVALVHRPPQPVTADNTRPVTLTIGLNYGFAGRGKE